MAGAVGKATESMGRDGKLVTKTLRKGVSKESAEGELEWDGEIPFGKMLRCRIRYFTDGAVIGTRSFVDEAFVKSRARFGPKRTTGARRMSGEAAVSARPVVELQRSAQRYRVTKRNAGRNERAG